MATRPQLSLDPRPQLSLNDQPQLCLNDQLQLSLNDQLQLSLNDQLQLSLNDQPQHGLTHQPQLSLDDRLQLTLDLDSRPLVSLDSRPHLTLDNFDTDSVPPDCPFVLTSPRSLEACRRLGVQPVDLLPTPLFDYQAQLPDLSREQVLSIFREAEEDRELNVALCRRLRNQIVLAESDDVDQGLLGRWSKRESCCLSPIVEVGGRDSALGTSQTLSHKECPSDAPSPVPQLQRPSSLPSLSGEQISGSRSSLSPELYTSTDRPEADQDLSNEDQHLSVQDQEIEHLDFKLQDLEFGSQDIHIEIDRQHSEIFELDRQQSEILESANQEIEIYNQEHLSEDSSIENNKKEPEEGKPKEGFCNSDNQQEDADRDCLSSFFPIQNLYKSSFLSFSDGDLTHYSDSVNHRPEFQRRQTPEGTSTPEGFNTPEGRYTPDYRNGILAIAPLEGRAIPEYKSEVPRFMFNQVHMEEYGDSSECRSTPSPSLVLRKTANFQDLSSHLSDQDTSRLGPFGRRGEDRVGRCYSESSDNSEDPDNLFLLRPAVTFSMRNQVIESNQVIRNQSIDTNELTLVEGRTTSSTRTCLSRNIKVYQNPCGPPLLTTTLSPYAKTCPKSSTSKKKKAKRKTRLTSDSVTSLNLENEDPKNGNNAVEDDVPEAERFNNPVKSCSAGSKPRPSTAPTQTAKSPWNKSSPTLVMAADSEILRAVLSGCRSEVDLRRIRVTEHDCKLLELMALKKRQQCLQEMKADRLHAKWQSEREKRENNKALSTREWRRNLEAKRKREAEDNLRRLQEARNNFLNSQELLRKLLKEKDERSKIQLVNISKKRGETKRENRELEDQRSVDVSKAVEELLTRDTQYRKALQTDLERKQETAEKRRKQREEEEKRRIVNNNRSEEEQHKERMKRIEEMYSQHIHQIKSAIESKQQRSVKAVSGKKDEKIRIKSSNRLETAAKQEQAFALKSELETGLDKWRHQVLEVQSMSIRRAEEKSRREVDKRREKVAEEIKTREMRHQELRGKCEKEVKDQQAWHRRAIWQKQKKVERMLDDRERAVERARKMAFKTAELRDVIRNQSCSDLRITGRGGSLSKNVTLSKNSSHLHING